jgi:hypothetical protein
MYGWMRACMYIGLVCLLPVVFFFCILPLTVLHLIISSDQLDFAVTVTAVSLGLRLQRLKSIRNYRCPYESSAAFMLF